MPSGENSNSGGGYLQQRQAQAISELAEAERRLEGLRTELDRHYPACEVAAASMQQILSADSARCAADLRSRARKAARGSALTLKALLPGSAANR